MKSIKACGEHPQATLFLLACGILQPIFYSFLLRLDPRFPLSPE